MISDKKIILINTVAAYLRLTTGVIVGVFVMRAIFRYLSAEEYGFWVLLWSIFGYAIFMDFGFGYSMEKFIPRYLVAHEDQKIIEIVNTVFFLVLTGSVVIILATFILSNYLGVIFKFQAGHVVPVFKTAFILFGILTAIRFPFGLFEEVLVGLHKMYMKDLILAVFDFCSLAVTLLIVHFNKGLLNLIIGFLSVGIAAEFTCFAFAVMQIRGFKLRLCYFDKKLIKNVTSFSLYSYICKCAATITGRLFQLIVGALLSVASVGVYQVASRLPAFIELFARQIVPTITPYASKLEAQADKDRMKNLVYTGTKIIMFMVIPLAFCVLFFSKYILTLWLGKVDAQVFLLIPPIILTVSLEKVYGISTATFIMHEGQKKLAWISIIRTVISVIAGVLALIMFGLSGLVWSSLIITAAVYLFMIHPEIAKLCSVSSFKLFTTFIKPHIVSTTGLLIVLLVCMRFFNVDNFIAFFTVNFFAFLLYTVLFYIYTLDKKDREMLSSIFMKIKKI